MMLRDVVEGSACVGLHVYLIQGRDQVQYLFSVTTPAFFFFRNYEFRSEVEVVGVGGKLTGMILYWARFIGPIVQGP